MASLRIIVVIAIAAGGVRRIISAAMFLQLKNTPKLTHPP
jgi:hypothetical protein